MQIHQQGTFVKSPVNKAFLSILFHDLNCFCPCLCVDAFHAAVQPAGEAAPAEVVHSHSWARQKEDGQGADADSACPQTKDVQLPWMEGPQDCL